MHKQSKIKKIIIFAAIFAGLVFVFGSGNAEAKTATDGNLMITYEDPLFTVANAMPGEDFSSSVKVENTDGKDHIFQFELQMKTNPEFLADRIFFKINFVDTLGAETCEYGCADDKTLSGIDGNQFEVKVIPAGGEKNFKFILTFDKNAGNEFQKTSTSFDLKMGFKDESVGTTGGGGGTVGGGTTGTTATGLLAPFAALTGITTGTETGEDVQMEQEGEIKGEETAPGIVEGDQISVCQSWPKWVWVLALIVYFAAFLWRTFEKIKEQIEKRDIRWKWQAVLAAAAFLFWYFFDKCREYRWFIVLAIIGGAIIYLFYLYLFKKRLQIHPTKETQEPSLPEKDQ